MSCSCCTCRTTCCSTCCSDIPIAEATGCVFVGAVGEGGGWTWTTTSPDLRLEGCCVWCHKQALLCVRGAYFVSPLCTASATPYASGFTVWWHPMGVCCVPECCGPLHVTWGGCAPLCVCVVGPCVGPALLLLSAAGGCVAHTGEAAAGAVSCQVYRHPCTCLCELSEACVSTGSRCVHAKCTCVHVARCCRCVTCSLQCVYGPAGRLSC